MKIKIMIIVSVMNAMPLFGACPADVKSSGETRPFGAVKTPLSPDQIKAQEIKREVMQGIPSMLPELAGIISDYVVIPQEEIKKMQNEIAVAVLNFDFKKLDELKKKYGSDFDLNFIFLPYHINVLRDDPDRRVDQSLLRVIMVRYINLYQYRLDPFNKETIALDLKQKIERLMKLGMDPNKVSGSILHDIISEMPKFRNQAFQLDRIEDAIKMLLKAGANPNQLYHGISVLTHLVKVGCGTSEYPRIDETNLIYNKMESLVDLLLEHGADKNLGIGAAYTFLFNNQNTCEDLWSKLSKKLAPETKF